MNELQVWFAHLDIPGVVIEERLLPLLANVECERAQRLQPRIERSRFIAARAFLRQILASETGSDPRMLRFTIGRWGKPSLLPATRIEFNLSHSQGIAALAINRLGRVGVDLERMDELPEMKELMLRYLSCREQELFQNANAAEQRRLFYLYWTAKEAYRKGRGEGLSAPLNTVEILANGTGTADYCFQINESGNDELWSVASLQFAPDFQCSVVAEGPPRSPAVREWCLDRS